MGYTDTMLDQARAKLDAGETAAAWELTTAIAKAEPENVRAWELLADIIAPVSPDRASTYRAKARAAEAKIHAPSQHHGPGADQPQPIPPLMPYQPSPAKIQLGQDIAQAEGDLIMHQNSLRAIERQLASARSSRTGGMAALLISLFGLLFLSGLWLVWVIVLIAGMLTAASASTRVAEIEKDLLGAEAAITDIQQQLAQLRMRFSMML